jgi:hypothetical protein
LLGDVGCCFRTVVLDARVLLLAEALAWLAIGCCCYSAVVLVALVLLLVEASAWRSEALPLYSRRRNRPGVMQWSRV